MYDDYLDDPFFTIEDAKNMIIGYWKIFLLVLILGVIISIFVALVRHLKYHRGTLFSEVIADKKIYGQIFLIPGIILVYCIIGSILYLLDVLGITKVLQLGLGIFILGSFTIGIISAIGEFFLKHKFLLVIVIIVAVIFVILLIAKVIGLH